MKSGNVVAHASGFFYTSNDRLFLVTNQHVFRDPKKNLYPDHFRLTLHTDANDISKNADFDIPLYSNGNPLWKTHPSFQDADVALIEVDQKALRSHFLIKAWSKERFFPKTYRLEPGEDVFIIGYPLSFYDVVNNLPIFRNAMIASAYRVNFQNQPYFLTDANLHPGTSGSPVITKPKNVWIDDKGNTNMVTGTVYFLVGVHSGTIDTSVTHGEKIGLGAAWYSELIEDIVSVF
jgi:hypothetical protein